MAVTRGYWVRPSSFLIPGNSENTKDREKRQISNFLGYHEARGLKATAHCIPYEWVNGSTSPMVGERIPAHAVLAEVAKPTPEKLSTGAIAGFEESTGRLLRVGEFQPGTQAAVSQSEVPVISELMLF